jgi:hypothetical protein
VEEWAVGGAVDAALAGEQVDGFIVGEGQAVVALRSHDIGSVAGQQSAGEGSRYAPTNLENPKARQR